MRSKNVCTYCQQIIKDLVIVCKECPNFFLCFQCFRLGAELGKHKYTHKYEYNATNLPIFSIKNAWNALEEIKLLDTIEHYGLGNWEAIAMAFNNKRSPDEIAAHFEKFYIEGNIGKETLPLIPSNSFPKIDREEINIEQTPINNTYGNAIGYMPLRDDYEREFCNDAEMTIKDLHFEPTDDDLEIRCKYALYDSFCRVLKERQRRKTFAKDYFMIESFFEGRENGIERVEGKNNDPIHVTTNEGSCEKAREMVKFKEKIVTMARLHPPEGAYLDRSNTLGTALPPHNKENYRTPTPTLKPFRSCSSFHPPTTLGPASPFLKSVPRTVKNDPYHDYDDNARDGLEEGSDGDRNDHRSDQGFDRYREAGDESVVTATGLVDWDNEICKKLKPYARFYKRAQFIELCTNIIEYNRLQEKLKNLKECRKFGITKLKDADRFIAEYLIPLNEEKAKGGSSNIDTTDDLDGTITDNHVSYPEMDISRDSTHLKREERSSFSSGSSLISEDSTNRTMLTEIPKFTNTGRRRRESTLTAYNLNNTSTPLMKGD